MTIIRLDTADDHRAAYMASRKLPAGVDQQGRYTPRPFPETMPAEACTEIGAEPCSPPVTRVGLILILLGWPLVAVLVAGALAVFWPA